MTASICKCTYIWARFAKKVSPNQYALHLRGCLLETQNEISFHLDENSVYIEHMELLLKIAEKILNAQENLNKMFLEEFPLTGLCKVWESHMRVSWEYFLFLIFFKPDMKFSFKSVCLNRINQGSYPAGIYLLKINNRNTKTRCEICPKLTIKTPKWRQALFWCLYC